MSRYLLFIAMAMYTCVYGQTSDKYNSEYANFYRGEELFEKEQYGAARKTFRTFLDEFNRPTDPLYVKASYYEAVSALELYNNDALKLLEDFNKNYPESIYKMDIYFRLGKFYYYKKDYENALAWFNKLSAQDLEEEDRDEFYFKVGYSYFKQENYDKARDAFYEVKEGTSQYATSALYYYSHIAYQNEQYQTALDGFLKLENDESFGKVVVYYIAQIYYLQGKYDLVTEYATQLKADGNVVNENDLNHLIGDAYYRTEKYDEAVPYLEKYNRASKTTRDDDYQLGYAYYRSGQYDQAVRMFDRVTKEKDSLGQVAYYHIGECMLKQGNKASARSAFEDAAFIEADEAIQEDALYNYAILSYQLDINPYGEAVEAFEMYLNKYPNTERRDNVYQYLVNVYTSTNNYEKALSSLDKIPNKDLKLKTAYQLVAFNQGVDRFQKNDYKGALESFTLVKRYPVDSDLTGRAQYWTADAHYRMGKYDEAISEYKQFIALPATNDPRLKQEAQYSIGYAYVSKGAKFYDKTIEAFRSYLQTNPSNKERKADAYMRVADAYYMLKNNEPAAEYYKMAYDMQVGREDQALYYLAKTYGYMGRKNDKIINLLDIINNYKSSDYMIRAIYEVAETYKSDLKLDQALKYYEQLVNDHPASDLVMDSKINIADIYGKNGNYSLSEQTYKSVMAEYGSDQKVCAVVAEGLRDLYLLMNELEKIEQLASEYPCFKLDPNDQENLYYIPAMQAYMDSTKSQSERYNNAIPKFEKYLAKFPNGRYTNEVKNYLADCHFNTNNIDLAIMLYKESLEGPNTAYTELAAARVSKHSFNNGKYEDAIKYYTRVESVSTTPEVVYNSRLGLMRSHFLVENWANSSQYADKVLASSQISNEIKLEAYYAKGMSNYHLNRFDEAKPALEWIISNTTTERASQARFSLAEMYFKRNDLGSADTEVTKLLKMKPMYNYWVAKGLILRTRVYMSQDKLYDAEQTLRSVIDHYTIQDDGILEEADVLWNELMQLKNAPKNLSPDVDPIININPDGE